MRLITKRRMCLIENGRRIEWDSVKLMALTSSLQDFVSLPSHNPRLKPGATINSSLLKGLLGMEITPGYLTHFTLANQF